MIAIFHLLASIVTWIVMILVSITTVGKLFNHRNVKRNNDCLTSNRVRSNSRIGFCSWQCIVMVDLYRN